MRKRAEALRAEGYAVVTPDLFGGRVAKTIEEAKALTAGEHDREAALTGIVDDAVRGLAKDVERVGIVAWSFGNYYAWKAAKTHRDLVHAVVLFYGLALDDAAAPVPPILSHYAELDEFEDLEDTRRIEREMKASGNDVHVELYPGRKHWFDEPSRPEFDRAASALAWERSRAFLKRNLGA